MEAPATDQPAQPATPTTTLLISRLLSATPSHPAARQPPLMLLQWRLLQWRLPLISHTEQQQQQQQRS